MLANTTALEAEGWGNMYNTERAIIDKMSIKRKAKVWAKLNAYKTPKELIHLKDEIKIISQRGVKNFDPNSVVTKLMNYIELSVTHRQYSYAWWVQQKLDIENHNEWFDKNYGKEK